MPAASASSLTASMNGEAARVGQPADRVAMRAAAEAMVEALLVVDREARRLLVVERAAGLPLAPGRCSFSAAADQGRERGPGAKLVEEGGERVTLPRLRIRKAAPSPAALALLMSSWPAWRSFSSGHHPAHVLDRRGAGLGDDRVDRGADLLVAHLAGQEFLDHRDFGRLGVGSSSRPPFSYMSINSRRCLIIFCSTSVTSSVVLGRVGGAAQLDVAVLERRLDQADRAGARPCRRPSWRRPAPP